MMYEGRRGVGQEENYPQAPLSSFFTLLFQIATVVNGENMYDHYR